MEMTNVLMSVWGARMDYCDILDPTFLRKVVPGVLNRLLHCCVYDVFFRLTYLFSIRRMKRNGDIPQYKTMGRGASETPLVAEIIRQHSEVTRTLFKVTCIFFEIEMINHSYRLGSIYDEVCNWHHNTKLNVHRGF